LLLLAGLEGEIMSVSLTEEEFSKHIKTKFRIKADTQQPVELLLEEVKSYGNNGGSGSQPGMERFSVFFSGPNDCYLPQKVYSMEHDRMGPFDIFLVPIGRDDQGYNYEAVFNYFK
jgi:hypothetical protein